MASLMTCLGAGKGTWVPVIQLMESTTWEHIFLIMPQFFADKYEPKTNNITKIIIDDTKEINVIAEEIKKEIDGKVFGDVALNIGSGGGKEHMSMLAALLKAGCGFRLVMMKDNQMTEL